MVRKHCFVYNLYVCSISPDFSLWNNNIHYCHLQVGKGTYFHAGKAFGGLCTDFFCPVGDQLWSMQGDNTVGFCRCLVIWHWLGVSWSLHSFPKPYSHTGHGTTWHHHTNKDAKDPASDTSMSLGIREVMLSFTALTSWPPLKTKGVNLMQRHLVKPQLNFHSNNYTDNVKLSN